MGCAGTLFWLLASNSYPDYDGYTVYTSRVAVQQPPPAWPALSPELLDVVRISDCLSEGPSMCPSAGSSFPNFV